MRALLQSGDDLQKKNKNISLHKLKNTSLSSDSSKCLFCGAHFFDEEKLRSMWCCGEGRIKITFPQLDVPFYTNAKFLRDVRSYNNLFSFSALGVSGGFQGPQSGPSLVKIQGRIYHRIFDLNYKGCINNSTLYVCDNDVRLNIAKNQKLDGNIVIEISNYLEKVNPLVTSLKCLNNEKCETAHLVFEKTERKTEGPILRDRPMCAKIAGILNTSPQAEPRKIVIWKNGEREPQFIHFLDPAYESLQYPILFPHASAGWSIDLVDENNKNIAN